MKPLRLTEPSSLALRSLLLAAVSQGDVLPLTSFHPSHPQYNSALPIGLFVYISCSHPLPCIYNGCPAFICWIKSKLLPGNPRPAKSNPPSTPLLLRLSLVNCQVPACLHLRLLPDSFPVQAASPPPHYRIATSMH
uniref:Putative secreted protein n=1 Tax=Desmodus rotundus TaxID=9430 RepID=K9IGV3_DESRO